MIELKTYSNKKTILINIGRELLKQDLIKYFVVEEVYKEDKTKHLKEYKLEVLTTLYNYPQIKDKIKQKHNYKDPIIIYTHVNGEEN